MKKSILLFLFLLINKSFAMQEKKGFSNPDFKLDLVRKLEQLKENREQKLADQDQNEENNVDNKPHYNSSDEDRMDIDSD